MDRSATILIAEDSASDRLLLASLLRQLGHTVVEAVDGADALRLFASSEPQLVLLDAVMPQLDGFEVARRMRRLCGDRFVPIIFLTSLQDAGSLAAGLDAGGDDFLSKPYDTTVLRAKLGAFLRMAEMHRTLASQRDEIARHNRYLVHEQEVAKRVFDKVAHSGALGLPNLRYAVSPLAIFNGDVLLAATGPQGNLQLLLGDFTGHGLAAAIGAMPLAQIFYAMVAKGFHQRELLREINDRLHQTLPAGVFCCATAVSIDFADGQMEVWNGGLPDGLLCRTDGTLQPLVSRHLPLGILPARRFSDSVERYPVTSGDRLLLWSDGIADARNASGERFGEERLLAICRTVPPPRRFDAIQRAVRNFRGGSDQADDASLLEVTVVPRAEFAGSVRAPVADAAAQRWRLSFDLEAESLRSLNPLPLLLHFLMEVPGLRSRSSQLHTVLAELYTNAVEHGVLELDSTMKSSAAGFSRYYRAREQRLQALQQGRVRFELDYRGDHNGGLLRIAVADSGEGFDFSAWRAGFAPRSYAGRGLALLQRLGLTLRVPPPGNCVYVEFRWQEGPDQPLPANRSGSLS
jgi:CheY-like chemotaxis protein/anti-sigma regulatory factor (Ser/Thr protein kinase)